MKEEGERKTAYPNTQQVVEKEGGNYKTDRNRILTINRLSEEVNILEGKLKAIGRRENYLPREDWKEKLELNAALGEKYETLGKLSSDHQRFYFVKSIQKFADAAMESRALGKDREAREYYVRATRLSREIGDEKNVKYFAKQAQEAGRRRVKKELDEHVRTVHIFLLLLATVFFSTPQIRGAVTGISFSAFSYLGIVFFVALLIAVNLKVYAKLK